VTAICSSKNAEYVRTLGADSVIDYTTLPVLSTLTSASTSQKYDLIVDCVGGADILSCYATLLHPKGAYVTIVGDRTNVKSMGGPITYFTNPRQVWRYIYGWFWGPRYACVSMYQKSKYLEKVVGLGERGLVRCEVQEVIKGAFGEEEAWRRAVEAMEGGRVRGKIVLEIP
jgi:NADPH:quinone reductase-like Zn-dependent oxidoreductase